jgi:hypothetical protein
VPERSVEVRVDETLPSPVPQPPSSRTSPITSPARTRALAAPRPVTEGPVPRFLLAGTIDREAILDVRIDPSPPDQRGSWGPGPGVGAPIVGRRPTRSITRSR